MPPKRATRSSTKALDDEDDKKKTKDESESEEDDKPVAKGKKGAAKKDTAAKGKKGKAKDDDDDEKDDKALTRKSSRAKNSAKKDDDDDSATDKRKASKSPDGDGKDVKKKSKKDDKESAKLVKVVTKGGAAVDEYFDETKKCHVYIEGNKTYAVTLNQSNLARNNNKFYIIQVIQSEEKKNLFWTYNRWGRVGVRGQESVKEFDDAKSAIRDYEAKLRDKTVKGDYKVVDINYDDDAIDEEDDEKDKKDDKKGKKDDKKDDKDDDEDEEDDEEDEKDKKEPAKLVKVVTKGGVAIDQYFDEKDCHVYIQGNKIYAVTLNQSNLDRNNNKFYIIQVIESEKQKGVFWTYNRWGRVGVRGQDAKKRFSDVQSAIADYESKLYDKTVKGNYKAVEINYDDGMDEEQEEEKEKDDKKKKKGDEEEKKSKLPEATKKLVQLIFDLNMMNAQMKEIGYDAKKMPLGKLSKTALQKGYEILKELSKVIDSGKNKHRLSELSGDFYTYIPHDFGFQQMSNFIIDTDVKVRKKLEMLQSLEDIQVATKILEGRGANDESAIDQNYKKLKCDVTPLDPNSDEFKLVQEYTKNTHATTHNNYTLDILDVFKLEREGEAERYRKDVGNKMLLWHGSRLTNFVGIISQGLRIAPPEAPVTGYMFGKGVYFADMVSKSANYCFTNAQNNTGCMLLCEVALGDVNEKLQADYYAKENLNGKLSTKGCGKTAPPASSYKIIDGDVQVPCGKGENTGIPNCSLLYNEFIVYDTAQIKMKYLLKLRFNHKY